MVFVVCILFCCPHAEYLYFVETISFWLWINNRHERSEWRNQFDDYIWIRLRMQTGNLLLICKRTAVPWIKWKNKNKQKKMNFYLLSIHWIDFDSHSPVHLSEALCAPPIWKWHCSTYQTSSRYTFCICVWYIWCNFCVFKQNKTK